MFCFIMSFFKKLFVAFNNLLNRCRIIQSAEVPQTVQVALHDFPQDPPHDLTRAGLWQTFHKLRHKPETSRVTEGSHFQI